MPRYRLKDLPKNRRNSSSVACLVYLFRVHGGRPLLDFLGFRINSKIRLMISISCAILGCALGSIALAGQIVVSMPGLLQLTRKIAPEGSDVTSFVPAGAAPETFEPTPALVSNLAKASFFVASAAPFERVWLPKLRANHPRLVIIDAFPLEAPDSAAKSAGGHKHEHDPHLWLSPPLLKLAASRIAQALINAERKDADQIARRLVQVKEEIDSVDAAVRRTLGAAFQSKQKFFVFHPSWGEYAKVYGLEQVALEADGHAPSPADMQRFIATMKAAKAKVIFAQPQFSIKDAQSTARLAGARVVISDPLSEDQFGGLVKFAQALRADFDDRK
jgi:zinc transport system substrate-binding protein